MSGRKGKHEGNREKLAEALRLHRSGVSAYKIGRQLGIKAGSVDGVLKLAERMFGQQHHDAWLLAVSKPWRSAAVKEQHHRAKRPASDVEKARVLREQGSTYRAIADRLGVSIWTARDWADYRTRTS